MGKKSRFRVFHTVHGDHIAVIEMDEDLLAPEAGVLNHTTGTLRPLEGGGVYTLIPVDDHTVATLNRLKTVYETITTKGASFFSTQIQRMDELMSTVGLLFGEVEYTVVENKQDLQNILKPPKDYEPKKVKYTVLGDLLKNAEAGEQQPDGPACGDPGHTHGPGCNHP